MSNMEDVNMAENDSSVMNISGRLDPNQTMAVDLNRYAMFNIIIKNTMENISSGVSGEEYVNLFGKLSCLRKSKSAPLKMHSKMRMKLMESFMTEIKSMLESENIEEKFEKLDKFVDECAEYVGQQTWRPSGNVSEDMRSYLMEVKMKKKNVLEQKVRDKEHVTESLKQQVSTLRTQIQLLESKLHYLRKESLESDVLDQVDEKIVESVIRDKDLQ